MAMHKELQVNTFITCYPEVEQMIFNERTRLDNGRVVYVRKQKNIVEIKALYVYNRRARTNGVQIPEDMVPFLESLNIKILRRHRGGGKYLHWAIGCTTCPIGRYELISNHTIPEEAKEVLRNFKSHLPSSILHSDYINKRLSQFGNTHKTFSLYPPASEFLGISYVQKVTALPEVNTWI